MSSLCYYHITRRVVNWLPALPQMRGSFGTLKSHFGGPSRLPRCQLNREFESVAPNGRASAALKALDAHKVGGSNPPRLTSCTPSLLIAGSLREIREIAAHLVLRGIMGIRRYSAITLNIGGGSSVKRLCWVSTAKIPAGRL